MRATLIIALLIAVTGSSVAWADAASEAQMKVQLAQAQTELARYKDGFERANAALTQLQAERDQALAQKTAGAGSLEYCQAKNVYLVATAQNILDHYQKPHPVPEPFTGLMRVRLENAQQEYQDQIRAGRFDPKLDHPVVRDAAATPAAPGASTGEPAPQPSEKH